GCRCRWRKSLGFCRFCRGPPAKGSENAAGSIFCGVPSPPRPRGTLIQRVTREVVAGDHLAEREPAVRGVFLRPGCVKAGTPGRTAIRVDDLAVLATSDQLLARH